MQLIIQRKFVVFLETRKRPKDFQTLNQVRTRLNNHTQNSKQRLVRGTEMTYNSLGFPSGFASSVVHDYAPNNHMSGVTDILNDLQTIDF